jgi:hypothetical protein
VAVVPLFIESGPPWSDLQVRTAFPDSTSGCRTGFRPSKQIPESLDAYRANPSQYRVFGIVRPGTVIRFWRADYMYGPEQRLFLSGVIDDGELAGTAIDIAVLSKWEGRNKATILRDCLRPATQ